MAIEQETRLMSLSEVSGQLLFHGGGKRLTMSRQYFTPLRVVSDQPASRLTVQYHISIPRLRWAEAAEVEVPPRNHTPTHPPPKSAPMIYGEEAKTIIAFLLLLFFQG